MPRLSHLGTSLLLCLGVVLGLHGVRAMEAAAATNVLRAPARPEWLTCQLDPSLTPLTAEFRSNRLLAKIPTQRPLELFASVGDASAKKRDWRRAPMATTGGVASTRLPAWFKDLPIYYFAYDPVAKTGSEVKRYDPLADPVFRVVQSWDGFLDGFEIEGEGPRWEAKDLKLSQTTERAHHGLNSLAIQLISSELTHSGTMTSASLQGDQAIRVLAEGVGGYAWTDHSGVEVKISAVAPSIDANGKPRVLRSTEWNPLTPGRWQPVLLFWDHPSQVKEADGWQLSWRAPTDATVYLDDVAVICPKHRTLD